MPNTVVIAIVTGLLGAAVGGLIALFSVRLPAEPGETARRPGRGRVIWTTLASIVIGVWAAGNGGGLLSVAATAVLGWQLLLIAMIDAENFWLPDRLTWPLVVTGLIAGVLTVHEIPWLQVAGAVGGFAMLWTLGFAYRQLRGRDGLGGGDPFLFAGAGAWVGWTGLPSVLLWGCGAALVVVLLSLVTRRAVRGSDRLAFGTYLTLGIWLTWLYGPLGF
jgi:leader peptidase (prepilin peptidase)/N-methyltransferase